MMIPICCSLRHQGFLAQILSSDLRNSAAFNGRASSRRLSTLLIHQT